VFLKISHLPSPADCLWQWHLDFRNPSHIFQPPSRGQRRDAYDSAGELWFGSERKQLAGPSASRQHVYWHSGERKAVSPVGGYVYGPSQIRIQLDQYNWSNPCRSSLWSSRLRGGFVIYWRLSVLHTRRSGNLLSRFLDHQWKIAPLPTAALLKSY
jgi:hypothetical protein